MNLRLLSMTPTLAPSLPNNNRPKAGSPPEERWVQEAAKDDALTDIAMHNAAFVYFALSFSKE